MDNDRRHDPDDVFRGFGIEVDIISSDNFLKIRETLTRIGIASKKDKTLFQSCHILHKRGQYAIVHFKELFALDGKPTDITSNDLARRNTIVGLLEEWGLVEVIQDAADDLCVSMKEIKVVSFREKRDWNLVPKYTIGKVKNS